MKIASVISAGLIAAAAMLSPTIATAQQREIHRERRTVVTHRTQVVHNGDRRAHYRTRRVCRTVVRNHRRVRSCRTIRVRY